MNKKVDASKFLDNLFEFLADTEGMTNEEIERELEEAGIDIRTTQERVLEMVSKFIGEQEDED